jgi:hypothetical protein
MVEARSDDAGKYSADGLADNVDSVVDTFNSCLSALIGKLRRR